MSSYVPTKAKKESEQQESNQRPFDLQSNALPTELCSDVDEILPKFKTLYMPTCLFRSSEARKAIYIYMVKGQYVTHKGHTGHMSIHTRKDL